MHLQCTMSSIFRLGSTSIEHALHVKLSPDLDIFTKIAVFCGVKNVSKTNLGSTIHYTYTSYNKYSRLCVVSEELRLTEIGLFL